MVRGDKNTEDKSNRIYKKVLIYYSKGKLQKALALCEKNDELLLNDSSFLNLKGLMHYVKGEMNEARRCWNLSYNKFADPISEKYLLDSKRDEELWKTYVRGVKHSKALNVTEAIFELEQCKMKSDFNSINVNNQLTLCYLEKFNYDEAISCINKVLIIDCNNKEAKENKKTLIDLNIIENHGKQRMIKFLVLSIVLVILIGLYYILIKPAINAKSDASTAMTSREQVDKLQAELDKNNKSAEISKPDANGKLDGNNKSGESDGSYDNEKIDVDKMSGFISSKNFKAINDVLTKWELKEDTLSVNEKAMVNKCKNFMDTNAGEYFYRLAFGIAKTGNYKGAIEYYNIGLKYGVGQFPYEDALYMLGVAYNKSNDYENSIKTFERYYTEYKEKTYIIDGNYIEDALRYLINMTKGIDDKKYQKYSLELKGAV